MACEVNELGERRGCEGWGKIGGGVRRRMMKERGPSEVHGRGTMEWDEREK